MTPLPNPLPRPAVHARSLHTDTRKLLFVGSLIFGSGVVCVVLLFAVFGGTGHEGPHTNGGWMVLIFALGCLPTGILTLGLGIAKVIGDKSR